MVNFAVRVNFALQVNSAVQVNFCSVGTSLEACASDKRVLVKLDMPARDADNDTARFADAVR